MADNLSPYEVVLAETVDDLELFIWWQETRSKERNAWARLLPSDLAVRLFDAGIRSVAAVAAAGIGQLRAILPSELWAYELRRAAAAWRPLPEEWRREAALNLGLRKG